MKSKTRSPGDSSRASGRLSWKNLYGIMLRKIQRSGAGLLPMSVSNILTASKTGEFFKGHSPVPWILLQPCRSIDVVTSLALTLVNRVDRSRSVIRLMYTSSMRVMIISFHAVVHSRYTRRDKRVLQRASFTREGMSMNSIMWAITSTESSSMMMCCCCLLVALLRCAIARIGAGCRLRGDSKNVKKLAGHFPSVENESRQE